MIHTPNPPLYPSNDGEGLLVRRMRELSERGEYEAVFSDFLTPREQLIVASAVRVSAFYGGARGCERRAAVFLPEWLSDQLTDRSVFADDGDVSRLLAESGDAPLNILPLSIEGSGYVKLTHRDFLGSVLALGLKRSVIGDISVSGDTSAIMFTTAKTAEFISQNLTHIGRDTVKCSVADLPSDYSPKRDFAVLTGTVASLRLDGVIAELAKLSRADAQSAVISGAVEVNYREVTAPDRVLSPGDIISVRGVGKFVFDELDGASRRGRLRFRAKKYV